MTRREPTQPDATMEPSNFQPVFILGPARAGTSLLYKTLSLHRDVSYISNWLARYPTRTGFGRLARIGPVLPTARDRAWFGDAGNAYVYGGKRSLGRRLFPAPVEGEPVFSSCGITETGLAPGVDRAAATRALRQRIGAIHRASGGTHFVNKRIANNRRVDLLLEAFPRAVFVGIVRDGRDVAASLARVDWWNDSVLWWDGRTPVQWAADGMDPWLACARNWVEDLAAMETGLGLVPEGQHITVRYEDLTQNRIPTLERIARFVRLDDTVEWLSIVADQSVPPASNWSDQLSTEAIETIEAEQHLRLEAYGYKGASQ